MSQTMTVAALKDAGFYYAKENVVNAGDLIDMLHYIDFLAQNNAVDAGSLELPLDGNEFKLTKSEVTKLFFGHIEAKKEQTKDSVIPMPAVVLESLKESVAESMGRFRRLQMDIIALRIREASSHHAIYESKLSEAIIKQREIQSIEQADPLVAVSAMIAGLPATNWNFHEFKSLENALYFVSRSDILLVHKNPEAGISYEINCGKFRMRITLNDMRINLYGHAGHVSRDGENARHIHPHVSDTGSVCWGNAKASAEEAMISGDMLKLIQIVDALLPNYGAVPYISIDNFKKNADARDERLRRERERKEKAPEPQTGPYGDQDFVEPDDDEEFQFEGDTENEAV